jgi:hypothetical protein
MKTRNKIYIVIVACFMLSVGIATLSSLEGVLWSKGYATSRILRKRL